MLSTLRVNVQRFLALVISFGLLLMSPGVQQFVIAQVEPSEYEQALARLNAFMDKLEELRSHIDRTQFDVEELSFELAIEDPETIVDWVRNNVYFEQYLGLLRGAQGTLMSRAGNSLDQAILLQKLLRDAGYETQIARGSLSDEQAQLLIQQMTVLREPEPVFGDIEAIKETISSLSELVGQDVEGIADAFDKALEPLPIETTETYQEVEKDTEFILNMLEEADIELGDPQAEIKLLEEAKDYFWLEYRLSSSEDWKSTHPVFHNSTDVPISIDIIEVFVDDIPQELHHQLRFQVFIEQKRNEELITHTITDVWEKSAFKLIGTPLTYTNFPDGLASSEELTDVDAVLEETNFFFPMFNHDVAESSKAFDVEGNAVPVFAATSPLAGVFQAQGSTITEATGFLSNLGQPEPTLTNPDDFTKLTAQFVEYTLIAPGGKEKKIKRNLLNQISEAEQTANSEVNNYMTLMGTYTFMLSVGKHPQGFIIDRFLDEISMKQDAYKQLLRSNYGLEPETSVLQIPNNSTGHLSLFSAFDTEIIGEAFKSYRHEPSLVVAEEKIVPDVSLAKVRFLIDIVNNERRIYDGASNKLDAQKVLQSGIWETYMEQIESVIDEIKVVSAINIIKQAQKDSTPMLLLKPENINQIDQLRIKNEAKTQLKNDLNKGYIIILPEESSSFLNTFGWWRIDPLTGTTLGMIDEGKGASFVEHIIGYIMASTTGFVVCLLIAEYITMAFAGEEGVTEKLRSGEIPRTCAVAGNASGMLMLGVHPLITIISGVIISTILSNI